MACSRRSRQSNAAQLCNHEGRGFFLQLNMVAAGVGAGILALCVAAALIAWPRRAPPQPARSYERETVQKTLENIKLPPRFKIRLYALVPGARSIAVGPQG